MEDLKNQIINKSGFLIYTDYWEKYFSKMTGEQVKEVFKIIFNFNLTFEILKTNDLAIEMVVTTIIDNIKRDAIKRTKQSIASAKNGKLGGRPKTQNNQNETKKADKDINISISNKPNKIVTVEKSDLDIFCEDVVNGFQSILENKMQRKITTNNWQKDIKLLISKDLQPRGEEQAKQDVINCIQAIADNWKVNYFPEVQSASAFREKFAKIENFLSRKKPLTKQEQLDLERKEQHERLAKFYSNQ